MTKAAEEWTLAETELRDWAKDRRASLSKSEGAQTKVQSPGGSSGGNSSDGDGGRRET